MTTPLNLPIVDAQGRATPYFLKQLQQMGVVSSDAMPTPAPVSIQYDYTGAILSGELPATVIVQRTANGVNVSAQCQWAIAVQSGTITATISGGAITITAFGSSTAVLEVKSVRNGVALYCNVTVNQVLGQTPTTGGAASGGGSTSTASCTTFNSISASTYGSPITTATLTVTVGTSGNVALSAPLTVGTAKSAPATDYPVYGKWQRYNGTSWVDVAAEVQSSPDCQINAEDTVPITYTESKGKLTVNTTQTGLTPGASAQFQLLARNGSGTRTMTFSGTASAVPQ